MQPCDERYEACGLRRAGDHMTGRRDVAREQTKTFTPQRMLAAFAVALVGLVGAAPAVAQIRVATVDELRRELTPGEVISVVQTTGGSVRGRLLRFGDTDLDLQTEAPRAPGEPRRRLDLTVPFSAIQSLERHRDSTKNGALIGAGVGAGIVLGMFVYGAVVDFNEIDEWASGYLAAAGIFGGIGALAGWAIDAARSKPHVRFDAPSTGKLTIRAVPQLSRGPGVAFLLSFTANPTRRDRGRR